MKFCRNCGAEIRFDIPSQKLVCDHCGSIFDPFTEDTDVSGAEEFTMRESVGENDSGSSAGAGEEVNAETAEASGNTPAHSAGSNGNAPAHSAESGGKISAYSAETGGQSAASGKKRRKTAANSYEVTYFTCPNCGGEIMSTNMSAAEYCSYCGRFVVLESRLGTAQKPDYIIPFHRTKEECQEIYRKRAAKAIYAPGAMKKAEYIDRMRGIYMPYHIYDCGIGKSSQIKIETCKTTKKEYIYHTYNVSLQETPHYIQIPFDASSAFPDNINMQILPYMTEEMHPFTPSVMSGFYANAADVGERVYEPDAKDLTAETVLAQIRRDYKERGVTVQGRMQDQKSSMKIRIEDHKTAMLPVWFLSWKNRNRVSYSVVNGQTGDIAAEFPVSLLRFFLLSLLCAVPLYFLFELFLTATPKAAMLMCAALAVGVLFLYRDQLRRLTIRELHMDDKGFFIRSGMPVPKGMILSHDTDRGLKWSRKKPVSSSWLMRMLVNVFTWTVIAIGAGALGTVWQAISSGGFALFTIYYLGIAAFLVYLGIRIVPDILRIPQKRHAVGAGIAFLSVVMAFVIHLVNPVDDVLYYAGCMFMLAGLLCAIIPMALQYNVLVTNALPSFFGKRSRDDLDAVPDPAASAGTGARTGASADGSAEAGDGSTQPAGAAASRRRLSPGAFRALRIGSFAAAAAGAVLLIFFYISAILRFYSVDTSAFVHTYELSAEDAAGIVYDANADASMYTDPDTGFTAYLEDGCDLLSEAEEQSLLLNMRQIAPFCNAAFVTGYGSGQTIDAALDEYDRIFGLKPGVIFMIDMRYRNLWIYSEGSVYRTITTGYANTITDNVYRYASRGEYYDCGYHAMEQIYTVLAGGKIAQPMKHISNLLLALIMGLLINYALVLFTTRPQRELDYRMIPGKAIYTAAAAGAAASHIPAIREASRHLLSTRRVSRSEGGHGGGGGGGGGGFGGGGGHSGGGGGHGF